MTRVPMVVVLSLILNSLAFAQTSSSVKPPAVPEKTAGEAMKNVQVLKDVPASEWNDVMFFTSGALGVGCEHCHAPAFDADTKKAKVTARNMMKMVRDINAANFGGRPVVTCNTCHQGSLQPKGMPALWNRTADEITAFKKQRAADHTGAAPEPSAPAAPAESLPSASQVFADYRKAVGGVQAKSLRLAVTVVGDLQPALTAELDVVHPDRLSMRIVRAQGGDVRTVINGGRGWQITSQGTNELAVINVETAMKNLLDVFQIIKFVDAEATGKVIGSEKVGDRVCTVIESTTPRGIERLYFDRQTGLLRKVRTETRAANFGVLPTEILFDDYGEVSGVKAPFSIVTNSVSERVRMTVKQMQINQSIDAAEFEPPTPSATPAK